MQIHGYSIKKFSVLVHPSFIKNTVKKKIFYNSDWVYHIRSVPLIKHVLFCVNIFESNLYAIRAFVIIIY
jgi:hypothetical protein